MRCLKGNKSQGFRATHLKELLKTNHVVTGKTKIKKILVKSL